MNRRAFFLPFAIGLFDILAQLLLLRELMVWNLGNERAAAVGLAAWLFWMGLGAILGGAAGRTATRARWAMIGLSVWTAAALPASMAWLRMLRHSAGLSAGDILSASMILRGSLAALAPVCLPAGALFTAACRRIADSGDMRQSAGEVYLAETVGGLAGAAAFTLLLARVSTPMTTAALAGACLLGCVFILEWRERKSTEKPTAASGANLRVAGIAFAVFVVAAVVAVPRLERFTLRERWGPGLTHVEETPYGNLAATRNGNQISLFENGALSAAMPDPVAAEYFAHMPLLMHPHPRRVFVIGGDPPLAREMLKHPVKRLKERYAPAAARQALHDPRVTLLTDDARRRLARDPAQYDVIVAILPEPRTLQINRYYTEEFFRVVRRRLAPGGVFVITVPYMENYTAVLPFRLLAGIYRSLRLAFPAVTLLPEARTTLLATTGKPADDFPEPLIQRAKERKLRTAHFGEPYIRALLDPVRIAQSMRQFAPGAPFSAEPWEVIRQAERTLRYEPGAPPNRDMRPIGALLQTNITENMFAHERTAIAAGASEKRLLFGAIAALMAAMALSIGAGRLRRIPAPCVALAVFVTGFSGMAVEVVVMLMAQNIYGALYLYMGLVLGLFMAGMAAGILAGRRAARTTSGSRWGLVASQAVALAYLVGTIAVFSNAGANPDGPLTVFIVWGGAALAGAVTGFVYPAALGLLGGENVPANLYGLDLVGACAGALLTAAFLVPAAGIILTLCILAWAHFAAAAAVYFGA